MKFGKLKDISAVDFRLPPDSVATNNRLAQLTPKPATIYLGCTGWSMKEWLGKVYPPKTKAKDFLQHYGAQFNTIELNATHYRIPDTATVEKWIAETPNDFRFCPKVPQSISHSHDLGLHGQALPLFCTMMEQLYAHLGCCFMQLPPYFGVQQLPLLQQFIEQFPKTIPLAIELRHESWFQNKTAQTALFSVFEAHNIATVFSDVAGRRDVLHMRLTNNIAMIRFVGNALHETDYSRIRDWVQRLKHWIEQGISEIYFFTHEPDNILAPELAHFLHKELLRELPHVQTRGPKFWEDESEAQLSLF